MLRFSHFVLSAAVCVFASTAFALHFDQLKKSDLNATVSGSKETYKGLRDFKVVLNDVLYRGGGSGGKIPLKESQLQALCQNGFSQAAYLYSDNMKSSKTVSCRTSSLDQSLYYSVHGFRDSNKRYKILKEVYEIIMENRGPMFVHCWNGWHASGEVAAIALVQFCDWSGDDAAKYWRKNIGDNKEYPSIQNHIRNFRAFPDLNIPQAKKNKICPEL